MTKTEQIWKIRYPHLKYFVGDQLFMPVYLIVGFYDVKGYGTHQSFRPVQVVEDD